MEQIRRVEYSSSTGSDLLIAQAIYLVPEFSISASGINDMRVTVTEARHHISAFSIDIFGVLTGIGE